MSEVPRSHRYSGRRTAQVKHSGGHLRAGAPEEMVYLRSPGNRAERATPHAQLSEVLFSPAFFTCSFNLTLIYFKLLNSLKALGNYFLKYTSCLNKAI